MTALIFNNPFPSGTVFVISSMKKTGTSTVAELARTDANVVYDYGYVHDPDSLIEKIGDSDAQILYVHKSEAVFPDWMKTLSAIHQTVYVNYDSLVYSNMDWELMKTNHDLLLELEKLLPEESLIRARRDEIRAKYK
ncbi:hypothetical protein KW516_19050 [Vibrio fluvialis]|nr:hypothetical protein [Vibrio fluvialis]